MILTPDKYPNLPKWPAVFVTGERVTPEQAKDIIFRTDSSVRYPSTGYGVGGNDGEFRAACNNAFGWDLLETDDYPLQHRLIEAWREEMRCVSTDYVTINRLATSFIGGPYGWCHTDGTILQENQNYGKWPSVEDIVQDWKNLLAAFPYINVVCTLFSGESCEEHSIPVCSIVVRDGLVQVIEPDLGLHTQTRTTSDLGLQFISNLMRRDYNHERGWPPEWISEFGQLSTAVARRVSTEIKNES